MFYMRSTFKVERLYLMESCMADIVKSWMRFSYYVASSLNIKLNATCFPCLCHWHAYRSLLINLACMCCIDFLYGASLIEYRIVFWMDLQLRFMSHHCSCVSNFCVNYLWWIQNSWLLFKNTKLYEFFPELCIYVR